MRFIDEVEITVASGNGGAGCVSFRREALVARGGPDGGDGGHGGAIIFYGDQSLHSLLDYRYKREYRAKNGLPGEGGQRSGASGKDLVLHVPPGTLIKDERGELLADLKADQRFVFLKGGRGGKGNAFFKNSVNQAPQKSQPGEKGEEKKIQLELKILADVGLVGFPNAGKSTLISKISAAKPKVADYPFTTLIPHLGVVRYGEDQSFVVADIPGLIKGAHKGVGLGSQFLRHIERTKVFLHVIDGSGMSGRDPWQDYLDIREEIKAYKKQNLTERREIVVLNKCDVLSEEEEEKVIHQFKKEGVELLPMSAVSGKNIKELVFKIGEIVFEK